MEEERIWVAQTMKNNPPGEDRMSLVGEDLLSHPTMRPPAEAKTPKMAVSFVYVAVEETHLKKNPAFQPSLTFSFC